MTFGENKDDLETHRQHTWTQTRLYDTQNTHPSKRLYANDQADQKTKKGRVGG